jgi:hypothetical protein
MSKSPKRRIERVRARVIDTAVDSSAETIVLHTAEDAKTLIRVWADLRVSPIDTAMTTTVFLEALLALKPGAATITTAGVTQQLDQDVTLQEIGRWAAESMQNDTNGILVTDKITFDTKAMRKMRAGDELVLNYVASTANDLRLRGTIYCWFKE